MACPLRSAARSIDRSQSQVGSWSQILLSALIIGRIGGCFPDETTSPPRFDGPREPRQRQGEGRASALALAHVPLVISQTQPVSPLRPPRSEERAAVFRPKKRPHISAATSPVRADRQGTASGRRPAAAAGRKRSLPARGCGIHDVTWGQAPNPISGGAEGEGQAQPPAGGTSRLPC